MSADVDDPLARQIARRVRQNPYGYLLLAAGAGYILGGGLFTRLTLRMFSMAARVAAVPLAQTQLLGLATTMIQARDESNLIKEQS